METPHQFTDAAKRGAGANVSPDALFSLVGDDEIIKAKTRLLVNMILENAVNTMLTGTTADRTALSRSLMPSIVKLLSGDGGSGVDSLRTQMMEMFGRMGGGGGTDDSIPPMPPPPPPTL